MIAYETGLRLSEILSITAGSVQKDFAGTPMLSTKSLKNNEERCVLITEKCASQVEMLEKYTKGIRIDNIIFTKKYECKNEYMIYQQNRARIDLEKFL